MLTAALLIAALQPQPPNVHTLTPGTPVDGQTGCTWQHRATELPNWYPRCEPTSQVLTSAVDDPCDPFPNAYAEPERAAACAERTRVVDPDPGNFFTVNADGRIVKAAPRELAKYRAPYPEYRVQVVSVVLREDGRRVVTVLYLAGGEGLVRFVDGDGATPWLLEGGR